MPGLSAYSSQGVIYLELTLIYPLLKFFPALRVWSSPVGLVFVGLALGLASLSQNVSHLILTQGILYAIGGGFAWTPVLFLVEEWWVRRRGFAYGAIMASLGLSGAILPAVLEWLLNSYSFRTTLRVCALSFVVLNFPMLFFFKPRLPLSQSVQPRGFDLSFWKCQYYLILQSVNIVQSMGYFLPTTYLPTFARSLGASEFGSISTVILLNAATFVGCLCMGIAVDKCHVTTCLMVSAIGSALSVFLLWGFSVSLPPLYVFSLAYGAFAGCGSSSWSAIMRDTRQKKPRADSGMIFAALSAGKGVANLCSGPLSEALLDVGGWRVGMAYGSNYGPLIVFTGTTALFGGWGYAAKRMGWL